MELTEKNGHASIEEILASVRRIIAEEPGSSAPLIDLNAPAHHPRGDGLLDDPSDFDLPSMFKSPAPASADKPAPLFGRLSEAIRAASNGSGHGHAAELPRSDQSLSALKLHRADAVEANGAPHFLLSTFHEATTPRADEIAAAAVPESAPAVTPASPNFAAGPTMSAPDATPSPANTFAAYDRPDSQPAAPAPSPQVPRQMAAFKDTRFRSMGSAPLATEPLQPFVSPFEATATAALVSAADFAATPVPSTAPHPLGSLSETPAPVLAAPEDLVAVEAPASLTAAIVASYPSLQVDPVSAEPPARIPPPVPATPAPPPAQTQASAPIEDSTADLLRPMLRQWLAENMPRMVEKALHIEVAESVKTPKK